MTGLSGLTGMTGVTSIMKKTFGKDKKDNNVKILDQISEDSYDEDYRN